MKFQHLHDNIGQNKMKGKTTGIVTNVLDAFEESRARRNEANQS